MENFTTRRERYNLYTTIHEGWSSRVGWITPDGVKWDPDPDRAILLTERTLTKDSDYEYEKKRLY